MITKKLLLAAIAATSFIFPSALPAQGLRIELGDRPYYSHGPRYWAGDYEMVWVPGHWSQYRHRWVHGHYVRGEHRRYNERRSDRYDNRRNDYRDDYRR
jgi:hypothetical protein